ncbi:transferrin-binding protein-like solute binding protein [Methylobacillus methanolivorans]|uniref:Transferrin-binding protein-like solute binding protein n=1 Tax=Methylobacillus methanolivorans TaxID=1848927 RepID=A0ABW8GMI5_9PROT
MKKLSLASLVLLAVYGTSFAAGENVVGLSTDDSLVNVGPSAYTGPTHGAANQPGVGVHTVGGGTRINAQVLYDTLRTSVDGNGIATIGGSAHSAMGVWALGRVTGSDSNQVYYGVWAGPDASTPPTTAYVAYVVGDNVTRSLDTVKGNSYSYTTNGVGQGNEFYTGTLTANFNAAGTGGTVTGGIASASNTITLDSGTNISISGAGAVATAGFSGSANTGAYDVRGLFYGANAEALGGVADHLADPSKSVGFAGTR